MTKRLAPGGCPFSKQGSLAGGIRKAGMKPDSPDKVPNMGIGSHRRESVRDPRNSCASSRRDPEVRCRIAPKQAQARGPAIGAENRSPARLISWGDRHPAYL